MLVSLKALAFVEVLLLLGLLGFRAALAPAMRPFVGAREIALTLLTPAVLLAAPHQYLLYLYLATAMLICSRNRTELAGYYLLLLPMIPVLPYEVRIGGAYLFQADIIMALGIGGMIGLMLHRPVHRHPLAAYDLAMLSMVLIFAYIGRESGFAGGVPRAFAAFFLSGGAAYFVFSRGAGTVEQARRMLLMLYLAGFVTATVALFEVSRHWSLYQELILHLQGFSRVRLSATSNIRGGLMRAGAAIGNSSSFGLYMAVIVSSGFAMRTVFTRLGYRVVMAMLLLALLIAQSRGAWIGAGAGYLVSCLYRGLAGRAAAMLVAGAVVVAIPSLIPSNSRLAESLGLSGSSAETGDYRRNLLTAGLEQIRSHPMTGQSGPSLVANLSELQQGQGIVDFVNSHLYVAMAAGVPLFVLWLLIWLLPLPAIAGVRRRVAARGPLYAVVLWPVAAMVSVMVALLFTSTSDRSLIWPSIALGLSGPLVAAARRGAPRATPGRRPLAAAA